MWGRLEVEVQDWGELGGTRLVILSREKKKKEKKMANTSVALMPSLGERRVHSIHV